PEIIMRTRMFASLLAGALIIPQMALGDDADAFSSASRTDSISVPAIPYAETIPWLAHTSRVKIQLPKLGLLLRPTALDFAQLPAKPWNPTAGPLPYMITRPANLNGVTR